MIIYGNGFPSVHPSVCLSFSLSAVEHATVIFPLRGPFDRERTRNTFARARPAAATVILIFSFVRYSLGAHRRRLRIHRSRCSRNHNNIIKFIVARAISLRSSAEISRHENLHTHIYIYTTYTLRVITVYRTWLFIYALVKIRTLEFVFI